MKKSELEHVIRAAKEITGETEFVVVGSQALHGAFPNLVDKLITSHECGAGNTLQFNGVTVPSSATYAVVVGYANADRGGASGGSYNLNVIDRGGYLSVNGGQAQPYYFRNTFGWNSYRSIVLNLALAAGANTLTFGNPNAYTPNFDHLEVAPLTIQTANYEAEAPNNKLTGSAGDR